MTDLFLPLLLACTAGYALYRRVDLFPTLLCGVEKGLRTALHILPTMIVILTAVRMLRVSGFVDLMGQACRPLLQLTGIPEECTGAAFAQANQRKRRAGARTGHYAHLRRRQRAGKNCRGDARRVRNESVYHQCVLRILGIEENTVRHSCGITCRFCRFCLRGVVCSYIVLTGENGWNLQVCILL